MSLERSRALSLIGYVPENPVCFQNLTVKEFLELVWALRGLRGGFEDAMDHYLGLFGLETKRDTFISELSRGMVQKVLVSAALMVNPKVLIMDEPMAGMDPEAQHAFKREIRKMASKGVVVLISSHLLDTVERLCTKVGIINKGVLVAEGSLEEVKKRAESGEDATLEEAFLKIVKGC
mgnify:CR=1 FL=1